MTAEEKAKELFDKYFTIFDNIDYHDLCGDMADGVKQYSKQSALMVVDEIIMAIPLNPFYRSYCDLWTDSGNVAIEYFNKVKEEINKL